jgi:hypothetical protein
MAVVAVAVAVPVKGLLAKAAAVTTLVWVRRQAAQPLVAMSLLATWLTVVAQASLAILLAGLLAVFQTPQAQPPMGLVSRPPELLVLFPAQRVAQP